MFQRNGSRSPSYLCSLFALMLSLLLGCGEAPPKQVAGKSSRPKPIATEERSSADETEVVGTDSGTGSQETRPGAATIGERPMSEQSKASVGASDQSSSGQKKVAPSSSARSVAAGKQSKPALAIPEQPEYVFQPQVLMTERDAKTCLVKVDDLLPDLELTDLDGEAHKLHEFLGEKLTVVVFWKNENRLGREQILRLQAETVIPFREAGVNVVAVNVDDPVEQIQEILPQAEEREFVVLRDPSGTGFAQLATARHPRTYLLDDTGKILWLDIEYSRSSARELLNAIHVFLGDRKVGDS